MSDFDFRDLGDDEGDEEFDDFSFDDVGDDDDDEFSYGQEIGLEDDFDELEPEEPGPVNQFVGEMGSEIGGMSSQQRLILSAMLFGNVLILSIGALLVTGRIL